MVHVFSAVYHYGYHTLKNRLVQYHEPAREPSDAEAVLEWGLNTPFTSQDKPPLAIAMVVTLNGVRSLRRYRLVIGQKSKLRLTQKVTAALASQSRDHRLTANGFFPCSIDREFCLPRLNVWNDLAEAMKALDGKKQTCFIMAPKTGSKKTSRSMAARKGPRL